MTDRPLMIRYLADPANAITAAGIMFSGVALEVLSLGHLNAAVACGLWAMLADQLDGIVAKRTKGRGQDVGAIGKALDGFADLIYGAILPAMIVLELGRFAPTAMILGVVLIVIGALRLSYFNLFGLSGRYFIGVPLSYDIQVLAAIMIAKPLFTDAIIRPLVLVIFAVLACFHVAPLKVPAPAFRMYVAMLVYGVVASGVLLCRA